MCWNADVSLNTFICSFVVGLLLYYTSNYTRYSLPELQGFDIKYAFYLSVISMQLLEYFIWKNLHNTKMNKILSMCGLALILSQAGFSILAFTPKNVSPMLFKLYIVFLAVYFIYKYVFDPIQFVSVVGKSGHLDWLWIKQKSWGYLFTFIWMLAFFSPLFFIKNHTYLMQNIIQVCIVLACILLFYNGNSYGSVWCWVASLLTILYLAKTLIWLPLQEHGICGLKH